jgi:hypothetical protein
VNAASLKGGGRADLGGGALALELSEQIGHGLDDAALMLSTQEHSCGVRQLTLPPHILAMAQTDSNAAKTAAEIRAWLLAVMSDKSLSAPSWARQAGVAASTIQRAIKPDYQFVTSSRTLAKLAKAAHVQPPSVAIATVDRLAARVLPIRYVVQAGNWIEADDAAQAFLGEYPVAPDPRFARYPQWLEQVTGDSINQLIPEGAYAHVVDAIELGYAPTTDDIVVVERLRDGGHLRERTIKQVVIADGAVQLWPRSTNPRWNAPVVVIDGCEAGKDVEVRIVGLVLSYTMPLRR